MLCYYSSIEFARTEPFAMGLFGCAPSMLRWNQTGSTCAPMMPLTNLPHDRINHE
jgi:hypothetical protein